MLGVSLLLEGFSLLVAVRTVTAGAASHGISFAEFVKRGMDPTSIAVMMEDGAACAGLVIAGQKYTTQWYCMYGHLRRIGTANMMMHMHVLAYVHVRLVVHFTTRRLPCLCWSQLCYAMLQLVFSTMVLRTDFRLG